MAEGLEVQVEIEHDGDGDGKWVIYIKVSETGRQQTASRRCLDPSAKMIVLRSSL